MDAAQSTPALYQCQRCGRQSPIEAAFVIRKRMNGSLARCLCYECASKQASYANLLMYLLLPLSGLLILSVTPGSRLGHFYLLLFAGLLTSIPLIVLHELSHALTAHALGFRVFGIHLGMGKLLFSHRLFDINWTIRPIPSSAVTVVAGPEMPNYRARLFLIHLAGPVFHAILNALLLWINRVFGVSGTWYDVILWTNVYLLVLNLFPHKAQVAVGSAGTDGWAMLNAPRLKDEDLHKRYASFYILETISAAEKGNIPGTLEAAEMGISLYPNDPNMLNALGYAYLHSNQYHKSRQIFLQALDSHQDLPAPTKAILLNNVAFTNIMLENPALFSQADDFSEQAYQALPWEPAIGGTRGGVLVTLDRLDEGIELLKGALKSSLDKRSKATDACLIAWGEWKRGNLEEAESYLALAQRLDSQCNLIERVRMRMRNL